MPRKASRHGEAYKARVWEDLRTLFQQDHLTDIMLAADGQSIPCHRVLLAAASEFFRDKLVTNPESVQHNLLDIERIDFDTLVSVVSFIYNGDIDLTVEKALKVCPASIKLVLPELMRVCEDFFLDEMSSNDPGVSFIIHINRMAKENFMEDLANISWQVMLREFQEFIKTDTFKEMSEADLIQYIEDEQLNAANEDPVFEAVVTWVRHDAENRKSSFENLLKHVALSQCSLEFLDHTVRREPLMMIMGCYERLAEALCQHARSVTLKTGTPRKGYTGKATQENSLLAVREDCWWVLKDTETFWITQRVSWMEKLRFSSVCMAGDAFVVTEGVNGISSKQCWKISLQTLEWARLPDLNIARSNPASVCVGKQVYVLGGMSSNGQALKSVEYLDEKAGEWCMTSDMPMTPHAHMAVNYNNNYIYVFEGYTDRCDITPGKTFVLDIVTKTWKRKTDMPQKCDWYLSVWYRKKSTCMDEYTPMAMIAKMMMIMIVITLWRMTLIGISGRRYLVPEK